MAGGVRAGAGCVVSAQAAPQKAVFASDVSTVQWPLADLDPGLPDNWKDYEFLVVEFRASSSQRFELGLVGESGSVSKRIHPLANVWVRASIPLRFYRQGLGDADELASTVNQPRNSYWINIEAGGHGPVERVRAISLTMRYPVRSTTIEIRKVSLSKTDAGDAVLDGGTPVIDDYGQYVHADWPGKARNLAGAGARMERRTAHAGAAAAARPVATVALLRANARRRVFSAWRRSTSAGGSSIRKAAASGRRA